MNAFIVRPFGTKNGVNFEDVQEKLIKPALLKAGITGSTTAAVIRAGNIRLDMFQLLLTTDLVIADISIHNANVFYELGVRHALRPGKTFLIRCQGDEVPFDLKTDRYFAYDHEDLEASVEGLYKGIYATLHSDDTDSPVFLMLPKLHTHNTKDFIVIPADFTMEMELAVRTRNGGKLRLLAWECRDFSWAIPALQNLGAAQFSLGYTEDARESWEQILIKNPKETGPLEMLATIYQRLGEKESVKNTALADELFARSDLALTTLIDKGGDLSQNSLGELYALKARNEKWRWVRSWEKATVAERDREASGSGLLLSAYRSYLRAWSEDLNEYYAAINSLGLLKIVLELAYRTPDIWNAGFDSDELAIKGLEAYGKEFETFAAMLGKTIAVKEEKLMKAAKTDVWLALTKAELSLLTTQSPERVGRLYQQALESGIKEMKDFNVNASKRQVLLYEKLRIMPANVSAVLEVFRKFGSMPAKNDSHIILFTGHMIDAPDRKKPRFPQKNEDEVTKKIRVKMEEILVSMYGTSALSAEQCERTRAIAGGACGGDIIFHEVCRSMGVISEMYLALPPEKYVEHSVRFAGNVWVERFYDLVRDPDIPYHILADIEKLPYWLEEKEEDYSLWERNNLWLLNTALSKTTGDLTLLVVWDGEKGDGPGGTGHMISEAEKKGARIIIIKPS